MLAYFGTDVDWGKGAVRMDVDGVMGIGVEGGDEVRGCGGVKVLGPGDEVEEPAIDKFLRGEPDVSVLLIVDGVLVRVTVGREARRGGEEVVEGGDIDCRIKYGGRSKSGRRQGGGSDSSDGSFNDGQGNVLEGDVFSRGVVNWAVGKLVLGPTVLSEWGEENVKLFLSETDNFSSGFFSKLLKVELGNGAKGFEGGCGSGQGWGMDNVGIGVNGGRLEGVWVDESNAGTGRRRRILGGPGDEVIIGVWACGLEEGKARDVELKLEFRTGSGGRPGDCGGRCAGGGRILEAGTSGTWVIPSVVGTVEDVVDDLKGGGGVLLVDGVQIGPRGDGEGR